MTYEEQVREMALEIAQHRRIDPMTSRDRCSCGHKHLLGRLTSEHIAVALIAQGWRKP